MTYPALEIYKWFIEVSIYKTVKLFSCIIKLFRVALDKVIYLGIARQALRIPDGRAKDVCTPEFLGISNTNFHSHVSVISNIINEGEFGNFGNTETNTSY